MKLTLDLKHQLLIEQLEIVLTRFDVSCQRNRLEEKIITEEKRQARTNFFKTYKPVGNKGNYMPTKGEWYEQ